MPGAHIDGRRYGWIGHGLSQKGHDVYLIDAPVRFARAPFSTNIPVKTKILRCSELELHVNGILDESKPTILVGPSWGSAVMLDSLSAGLPFTSSLRSCFLIGASLQAVALGKRVPGRSYTGRLFKPTKIPVLFLAGEQDRMAPPNDVARTCSRYESGTYSVIQPGANHLNWGSGRGWADRPDLDGSATATPESQRATTNVYLDAFIASLLDASMTTDDALRAVMHKQDRFGARDSSTLGDLGTEVANC